MELTTGISVILQRGLPRGEGTKKTICELQGIWGRRHTDSRPNRIYSNQGFAALGILTNTAQFRFREST